MIDFDSSQHPDAFSASINIETWADRVAEACLEEIELPDDFKYKQRFDETEPVEWISKNFFDGKPLRVETIYFDAWDGIITIFAAEDEPEIFHASETIIGLELPYWAGGSRMFRTDSAADSGVLDDQISWLITDQDDNAAGEWTDKYTATYSGDATYVLDQDVQEYLGYTSDGKGLRVLIYHEGRSEIYHAYPYL